MWISHNYEMLENDVRRFEDPATGRWYFSVVDTIALTTSSKDPQNYWKVLKNRLKKEQNELVTKINRLKLRARDGKSYLTDTADAETILSLLAFIPKVNLESARLLFEPFAEKKPEMREDIVPFHADEPADAELLVDAYEDGAYIYIEAMLGGISMNDLDIQLSKNKITIFGKRKNPLEEKGEDKDYFLKELYWVSFSRTLTLPVSVDTAHAVANESQGHLTIRLPKLVPNQAGT